MAFDRPPLLTGNNKKDIMNLRDYLFRMAGSLGRIAEEGNGTKVVSYNAAGQPVQRKTGGGGDAEEIEKIRKNAQELKSLIVKTANDVTIEASNRITGDREAEANARNYASSLTTAYDERYVAASEYGTFTESIASTIEQTARGVVESYNYASAIQSIQDGIDLLQSYYTAVAGEIRRGIVQDPSTGNYVTGIAISQNLQFAGECGTSDPNNPGDGNTYYYLTEGQTFGMYTSTGWQFWIDGAKVGWFDSKDGMLHVGTVHVEERIVNGGYWEEKTEAVNGHQMFAINYIGS